MPNLGKSQEQVAVDAPARSWFHVHVVLRNWLRSADEPLLFIENVEWVVRQVGLKLVESEFLASEELEKIEREEARSGGFGSGRWG